VECTGSRSVRRDSSTGFGIDVATSVAMDETKFRRKWDRVHPQDDVTLSPQRRKHSTVVTTGSPTVARRLGSSVPASAGSPPCVTHGGIEGAVEASGRDSPGSSIARAIAPRSGKAMPGFRHLSPARFGATVPGSGRLHSPSVSNVPGSGTKRLRSMPACSRPGAPLNGLRAAGTVGQTRRETSPKIHPAKVLTFWHSSRNVYVRSKTSLGRQTDRRGAAQGSRTSS
jgi:hypothetical protein